MAALALAGRRVTTPMFREDDLLPEGPPELEEMPADLEAMQADEALDPGTDESAQVPPDESATRTDQSSDEPQAVEGDPDDGPPAEAWLAAGVLPPGDVSAPAPESDEPTDDAGPLEAAAERDSEEAEPEAEPGVEEAASLDEEAMPSAQAPEHPANEPEPELVDASAEDEIRALEVTPAPDTATEPQRVPTDPDGMGVEGLVAARGWLHYGARAWIPTGPGDRATVEPGETVGPDTVVAERVRDPRLVTVAPRVRDPARFPPGARILPRDARARRRGGLTDEGTVLYRSAGHLTVVVGRQREQLYARADGTVVAVTPAGVGILVAGQALDGVAGAGQPVHGRLRIAVGDPGDELRSANLHVADAGSIVVAGARVDVETLTRARALGIHGVIAGGMAGHDLRSFARSEARQQAALHTLPPFAVLVLEGFGRRSLAGPPWELLLGAAGSSVSIYPDPPLLVFGPEAQLTTVPSGTLRIAAGAGSGTVGTIDGPAAMHRFDEGVHVLAVPFAGGGRRWLVPLADLERFQ